MSHENVEFLEGLFAGAADMDKQALFDAMPEFIAQMCDPDIEWDGGSATSRPARLPWT